MSTNSKDLRETLNAHHKCERKMSFGEACYWLSQYKELALRAILYAEEADKELEHLRSFANDITLKYEELRKLIDGGSESMTHADAVAELKALLSAEEELKAAREQEPIAYLDYWKADGTGIIRKQQCAGKKLYTLPIPAPAPAVPESVIAALKDLKKRAYRQLDYGKGYTVPINANTAIDIADALLQSGDSNG